MSDLIWSHRRHILLAIRRRELALIQVEKAINAIGRCGCADEHRTMLAELERAKARLQPELAALRYQAQYPRAAA